jgi:hypothetical protein
LDLLGFGKTDVPTLEAVAREICRIDGEDGLEFLPETVKGSIIREEEIYGGVRLNLLAMLEKARIPMQIDVGSGDAVTPEAREETLPTILDLLPAPRIRIYPKETVLAEKFEAMVKLGIGNSRMKDFWDIAYLIKEFEFGGELLQRAIRATFTTRQTPLPQNLPLALTDEFAGSALVIPRWNAFIRRNRITTQTDLISLIGSLREFFAPVIEAETRNAVFTKQWRKEGKWKE